MSKFHSQNNFESIRFSDQHNKISNSKCAKQSITCIKLDMYRTSNQVYGSYKKDPAIECVNITDAQQSLSHASVCMPYISEQCPRPRPENLPVAGLPSTRPICCKPSSVSSGSCNPHHFEPSYCSVSFVQFLYLFSYQCNHRIKLQNRSLSS